MTAGLPGLRTVPSPLAPRPQAGADLHVHTTHSDGLCSPCEVVIAAAGAGLAARRLAHHPAGRPGAPASGPTSEPIFGQLG